MTQETPDVWNPERYDAFRAQRERPGEDLLDLVEPAPGGRAVDLGCGSGRLTALLHDRAGCAETIGIDTSAAMLADRPADGEAAGLSFRDGDLREIDGHWDIVFANASLQWVPDHETLITTLAQHVVPGGQFAFQVPANFDHPSHTIADEVGRAFGLEPLDRAIDATSPARYAELLFASGFADPRVELRIYGHPMARTDTVIDWVSGTLLTRFERALAPEDLEAFRSEYRTRLLRELGDPDGTAPYFYAFPRILCHARRRT